MLSIYIYLWLRKTYSYWLRHKIPHIKPLPFIGNLKDLFLQRASFGELFQQLYANAEIQNEAIAGIYILHTPALIIRDPVIIRSVLIKHFHMFVNRYEAADPIHDSMGSLTLPLAKYPIWRESRKKLSEFFTSGRLKNLMYPQMLTIANELEMYLMRQFKCSLTEEATITLDVAEISALFTVDITALLSFGVYSNSLRNGCSIMRQQLRDLLTPTWYNIFHFLSIFFLPKFTTALRVEVFPQTYTKFISDELQRLMRERHKTIQHTIDQDNLLDLLTRFRNESHNNGINDFVQHSDFITSQAAIFLLAGFETSSSLIAFTLYELAKQPEIQFRLRSEIRKSFAQRNTLPHEELSNMTYLHMVVAEALRMYPAAAFVNRECTPQENAGEKAGFSLRSHNIDFTIPAGMPAYISILGLHRDPKYWPNPEHFDPERFSSQYLHMIQPMTYIPFGEGPHGCIGRRLGLLQVKLALVHILKHCKFELPCSHTTTCSNKIKFDPKSFMLKSTNGIYLCAIKDNLIE